MGVITKKELEERYKYIEFEKFGDNIIIRLYQDEEKSIIYFVRIVFVDNKIFYSGDMGTYVFGKDIVHPKTFFTLGNKNEINPEYWWQKCEAAQFPIYGTEIDEDKVSEAVKEELCEFYEVEDFNELDDYIIKDFYNNMTLLDSNEVRAYDTVYDFFESIGMSESWERARNCIDAGKEMNGNYLYACEVLQWVENNLDEWETKYSNKEDK